MNKNILIIGATATGKTAKAIEYANKFQSKGIINLDSRQIWKKNKILSASPNSDELSMYPHYLFNYLDENESWTVGKWIESYQKLESGNYCIVGGSIFYARCLQKGVPICSPSPETLSWYENLENPYNYLKNNYSLNIEIYENDKSRIKRHLCFLKEFNCTFEEYSNKFLLPHYTIGIIYSDANAHEKKLRQRLEIYWQEIIKECEFFGYISEFNTIIGYEDIWKLIRNEISNTQAFENIIIATRQYAKYQQKFLKKLKLDEVLVI